MRPTARSLLAALLASLVLGVCAAAAGAAVPIEGVWSFNGGKVAIQREADGSYTGTVVAPTKFAQCYHPVGEQVWTSIRPQSDGSYWGYHQWFFATEQCIPNPTLGLSAWRVLTAADGSRSLQVCFSEPGSTSQPTIGAGGASGGATYGCQDSARISALPGEAKILLPRGEGCVSARRLRIRLEEAKGDPFESIVVTLSSGSLKRKAKLSRHKGAVIARFGLRGLPTATFTVRVRLTTVLGQTVRRKRSYNVCAVRTGRHKRHPHQRQQA